MQKDGFVLGIFSWLAIAENEISDLETGNRKKKSKKLEKSAWYLWDNSKPSDMSNWNPWRRRKGEMSRRNIWGNND